MLTKYDIILSINKPPLCKKTHKNAHKKGHHIVYRLDAPSVSISETPNLDISL